MPSHSDMKLRTFFGIALNDATRKSIESWLNTVKPRVHGVRWIDPAQWHVTLRFLGGISPETLEEVKGRAAEVAAWANAGRLEATQSGLFRSLQKPRIAWIGVQGDVEGLSDLYQRLEASLEGLDVAESEARSFHPHITIGRIRNPKKVLGLELFIMAGKDKSFGDFALDTMTLFKSELTSEGAKYSTLENYCLGGNHG